MSDENKGEENDGALKIILMKGGLYKALSEKQLDGSQSTSGYYSLHNKGTNTIVTSESG